MAKLQLTLAASDYAHTREFTSGGIQAEGIEINYPVRKLVPSSPNGAQHLTETVVPGNAQPGAE